MTERRTWAGAVSSPVDVRAILDRVNAQGLTRATTTALAEAVQPAERVELHPDASKLLPVDDQLAPLLPWPGLRKGATVAVTGSTSVLLLLLAGAMREGSWAAVVGMPHLGCLAASEHGVPLDRLALVPNPGPDWPTVVGALIDGFDVVAVHTPTPAEGIVRSLQARARQKGCVLVPVGTWPGSDVELQVTGRRWEGLRQGRGRLKRQHLDVVATGRGKAARPRKATITLGQAAPVLIPPPTGRDAQVVQLHPKRTGPDPWAHIVPNEPADAWGPLEREVALPPRKRR